MSQLITCASELKESVAIYWTIGVISQLWATGENNDAVISVTQQLHLFKQKRSVEKKRNSRTLQREDFCKDLQLFARLILVCFQCDKVGGASADMSDRFSEILRESRCSGNYIPSGRQLHRTPPLSDVKRHLDFSGDDCDSLEQNKGGEGGKKRKSVCLFSQMLCELTARAELPAPTAASRWFTMLGLNRAE